MRVDARGMLDEGFWEVIWNWSSQMFVTRVLIGSPSLQMGGEMVMIPVLRNSFSLNRKRNSFFLEIKSTNCFDEEFSFPSSLFPSIAS